MTDIIGFAYALTVAAGGIVGFVKKGSIMSGLMGLAFGATAGYGAYQTSQNPGNYALSLGVAATLTGVMGYRFINSGKIMPAGVVAALSLMMVVRYGLRAAGIVAVNDPRK